MPPIRVALAKSTVVLIVSLCLLAIGASGQNVTFCNTGSGSATGTFGNIIVPPGATCFLFNATVNGSITANAGSQLYLAGGVTVKGSVAAYKSAIVQIVHDPSINATNLIYGSIGLVGTTGLPNTNQATVAFCGAVIGGGVVISGTQDDGVTFGGTVPGDVCRQYGGGNAISGDVLVQNNGGSFFLIASNYFGRNLLITGNKGTATKRVLNNQARSITCLANEQPFVSGGNSAPLLLGQCRQ